MAEKRVVSVKKGVWAQGVVDRKSEKGGMILSHAKTIPELYCSKDDQNKIIYYLESRDIFSLLNP